jgi:hypothetical protein
VPHACPQPGRALPGWRQRCRSTGHCCGERRVRLKAAIDQEREAAGSTPGFSLGDEVVFSGNLLRNGEQVGRVGVVCTFVSTANADRVEAQCPATAILPGGQITIQGVIVNRALNFTLPITPLQCSEQGGLPTGGLPEAPGGKFGQGARICDEARIGLHKST